MSGRKETNLGRPVAVTPPRHRQKSLTDRIRETIRGELSLRAAASEFETFEEANDFDVEDDFNLDMFDGTPYEEVFEPEPDPEDKFFDRLAKELVKAREADQLVPGTTPPGDAPNPSPAAPEPLPEEVQALTPESTPEDALKALAALRASLGR